MDNISFSNLSSLLKTRKIFKVAFKFYETTNRTLKKENLMLKLRTTSKFIAKKDILFSAMDKEIVMLNIEKGSYYGLNPSAAKIWKILQEEQTFESLLQKIEKTYKVKKENCEKDLEKFILDLKKHKLIIFS